MANEEDMNLLLIRSLICDTNVHAGNIIKGHYTKIANTGITVSGYDSWQPPLDPDLLDEMAAYFYTKDIGKDPIPIVRLTPEGIEKAKEALSIYLENMKDIWIDEFGKMDTITEVLIRDYCFNQKEQPGRTPFEIALFYDGEAQPQRSNQDPIIIDFMRIHNNKFPNFWMLLDKLCNSSLCVRAEYKNQHSKTQQEKEGMKMNYMHVEYRTTDEIYHFLKEILPIPTDDYNNVILDIQMYSLLSRWKNKGFGKDKVKFETWIDSFGFNGAEWLMSLETDNVKMPNNQPIIKEDWLHGLEEKIFTKSDSLVRL